MKTLSGLSNQSLFAASSMALVGAAVLAGSGLVLKIPQSIAAAPEPTQIVVDKRVDEGLATMMLLHRMDLMVPTRMQGQGS